MRTIWNEKHKNLNQCSSNILYFVLFRFSRSQSSTYLLNTAVSAKLICSLTNRVRYKNILVLVWHLNEDCFSEKFLNFFFCKCYLLLSTIQKKRMEELCFLFKKLPVLNTNTVSLLSQVSLQNDLVGSYCKLSQ